MNTPVVLPIFTDIGCKVYHNVLSRKLF